MIYRRLIEPIHSPLNSPQSQRHVRLTSITTNFTRTDIARRVVRGNLPSEPNPSRLSLDSDSTTTPSRFYLLGETKGTRNGELSIFKGQRSVSRSGTGRSLTSDPRFPLSNHLSRHFNLSNLRFNASAMVKQKHRWMRLDILLVRNRHLEMKFISFHFILRI